MKGSSKVIMGATLVMVVSLAIVLGLILVLLAELYCSLLLRRRRLRVPAAAGGGGGASDTPTPTTTTNSSSSFSSALQSTNSPLCTTHLGVLHPPPPQRYLLFPHLSCKDDMETKKTLHSQLLHQMLTESSPRAIGVLSSTHSSPLQEISINITTSPSCNNKVVCDHQESSFMYISNPIYDNNNNGADHTPFETPDTSPSRLETEETSSSSDIEDDQPLKSLRIIITPPLTPMKKLPAEASSVSMGDGKSLNSDSASINGGVSSSSSGSPSTSPSW
ncbi:hypothetical protein ACFE04_014123 [Oxalis oulophora]